MESKLDLNKRVELAKIQMEEDRSKIQSYIETEDMVDGDGYPTEVALWCVEFWPWDDRNGWFKFIKSIWWYPNWGWTEREEPDDWNKDKIVYRYRISTGGWSGNESVILAMQNNSMLWFMSWVQSRRGGHYIFEKKVFDDE